MAIDLKYGERYGRALDAEAQLKSLVAGRYDVTPQHVLVDFGANGLLRTILSAIAIEKFSRGTNPSIIYDVPNYYYMMQLAKGFHYTTHEVPRDHNLEFRARAFVNTMQATRPDVVMLTTPNNPTGKPISNRSLYTIVSKLPEDSIAVVDRTLVNIDEEVSTYRLLWDNLGKPVIVLHSFSKSHGLSDERIAYGVTLDEGILKYVENKLPLTLNADAVQAAIKAFDDNERLESTKQRIKESLDTTRTITDMFNCVGIEVYFTPSQSNFALVQLPNLMSAVELTKYMEERGILIMPGPNIGLDDNYVRLHMSGKHEIAQFFIHLGPYISQLKNISLQ